MEYENRPVPEGINVSPTHPLLDFLWMAAAVGGIVVAIVVVLSLAAGHLVRLVPFEHEQRLAQTVGLGRVDDTATDPAVRAWLQQLADALAAAQDLPEDIDIVVHYVEDDSVVNAYATLGGHVVIFSGLLRELRSENGLAMVLAHEIAHIRHRHPIMALGRGVALMFALSALGGFGEAGVAESVLGQVGMLTSLSFSRTQEAEADSTAVAALAHHYGHLGGADEIFAFFAAHDASFVPEMAHTHPLSRKRLAHIREQMHAYGSGTPTPLPAGMSFSAPGPRQHESTHPEREPEP